MTLTIQTEPSATFAGYNHQVFDVSSDNSDITRVIADIYVDGAYETTIEKSPQLGTAQIFEVDIRSVAQDYLTSDFHLPDYSIDTVVDSRQSARTFQGRFFELETSGSVQVTDWAENGTGSGPVNSSTLRGINAGRQFDETQSLQQFVTDSGKQFLTNRTFPHKITRGHLFQLDFLTVSTPVFAKLRLHDEDDVLISNTSIPDSTGTAITKHKGAVVVDTSAMASNVAYFTIELFKDGVPDVAISPVVRTNLNDVCTDDFPVYWQNSLGGFDYFDFTARITRSVSSKSSTYQKPLAKGFETSDRGVAHHTQATDEEYEVFTLATKTEIEEFLLELQANKNDVYTYIDSQFIPLIVSDATVIVSDSFEPVFELSMTVRIAHRHISQRG